MGPTNGCEFPSKSFLNLLFFFTNRGNALLIGSIGAHLNSLAALALYMLEYPIHPVDCTYPNTFLDGLRSAVRQAGCDGKTTTVLFTVSILPGWNLVWAYNTGVNRKCWFVLRFSLVLHVIFPHTETWKMTPLGLDKISFLYLGRLRVVPLSLTPSRVTRK